MLKVEPHLLDVGGGNEARSRQYHFSIRYTKVISTVNIELTLALVNDTRTINVKAQCSIR